MDERSTIIFLCIYLREQMILTLSFNDPPLRVNYITGKNGSGKSAILTAIRTAFGATAKETER
jgi:AAA15 family ATPase/GTPase